jgi:hypothetical protein
MAIAACIVVATTLSTAAGSRRISSRRVAPGLWQSTPLQTQLRRKPGSGLRWMRQSLLCREPGCTMSLPSKMEAGSGGLDHCVPGLVDHCDS